MSRATCLATLADNGRIRAHLMEKTGWRESDKPQRFVSVSFTADGIYKSLECRAAEACGCRYMSHRTGYQFSVRAWNRYVAELRKRAEEHSCYREALAGMMFAPVPGRDPYSALDGLRPFYTRAEAHDYAKRLRLPFGYDFDGDGPYFIVRPADLAKVPEPRGIGDNLPASRTYRTGCHRPGWQWACGHVVEGETELRCPMIGEPYRAPRRVEAYGSTRLRAQRAYAELIELR
ncbi:MAG TPA: hypothetical protein VGW40_02830 [Allosphingosinicella sp.]|nr:hypothetical protein [Allosphingosinicella sp.]